MGVSILRDPSLWLIADDDREDELLLKRQLYAAHQEQVWVSKDSSLAAQQEIFDEISAHLRIHHPKSITPGGYDSECLHKCLQPPLLAISFLVQEDLCLMQRDSFGDWRMTAASVSFPSRWHLPSKLGQTLTSIHAPVPGYAPSLDHSVNRFMDKLPADRIALRSNWSLLANPALYQPLLISAVHPPAAASLVEEEPLSNKQPQHVVLRTERQTLRRFPKSDAILFTIRTFRDPLEVIANRLDLVTALAHQLRTMESKLAGYKAIPALREPVLAWLDAQLTI